MGLTTDTIASDAARIARVCEQRRMITVKDIFEVLRIVAQGLLAWMLPQAAWWPLSRLFGTTRRRRASGTHA